jgi:hypothetical protein
MVRKNVAEIFTNHVTFELEAIDRMYLNAYVPSLQTGGGFVYFVKSQLGARVPSTRMNRPHESAVVRQNLMAPDSTRAQPCEPSPVMLNQWWPRSSALFGY